MTFPVRWFLACRGGLSLADHDTLTASHATILSDRMVAAGEGGALRGRLAAGRAGGLADAYAQL